MLALNGPLANEKAAFERFLRRLDLAGKKVLEIGGCLPEEWTRAAKEWHSIDPLHADGSWRSGHVVRHGGVAEALPLDDGEVEAIFACDSFQHVNDVTTVYAECFRVLKPGGVLYANFGPVWTAPDGSHIENVTACGRRWDFWSRQLLPPWSHLLLSHDRMQELAVAALGDDLGMAVAAYLRTSRWINRTPLRVHLQAPTRAGLQKVSFRGCQKFGYRFQPMRVPAGFPDLRDEFEVMRQCCEKLDMTEPELRVRDLELVVRKPAA